LPEAEWSDWKTFYYHINTMPGLSTLAKTPFVLKLLTHTLPRLLVHNISSIYKIQLVDVYIAFTTTWFEREMWKILTHSAGIPPDQHRILQYSHTAQFIAQLMFANNTTTLQISALPVAVRSLLHGLPLVQHQDSINFVHKSVQEFFIASEWISALASTSLAQAKFGAQLVLSDELIKFAVLQDTPHTIA
jgi:hypothetical protein